MTDQDMPAEFTQSQAADGSTVGSLDLMAMNLEQLEMVAQGLQRDADKLREFRVRVRLLIDQKIEAKRVADVKARIAELDALITGGVDAVAPGGSSVVKAIGD